jgi:hypothetical protein
MPAAITCLTGHLILGILVSLGHNLVFPFKADHDCDWTTETISGICGRWIEHPNNPVEALRYRGINTEERADG